MRIDIEVMVTCQLDKQYTKTFYYHECDDYIEALNKMVSEVNYSGYTLREIIYVFEIGD